MTPEQVCLIQESWSLHANREREFVHLFYRRLFDVYPSLQSMFNPDMDDQVVKFLNMLNIIINGLDDLSTIESELRDLGRQHEEYGVSEQDYHAVGACLLDCLARIMGRDFNSKLQQAWESAYDTVAGMMLQGTERAVS